MKNGIGVCFNESIQNTVKIPERKANRNRNSSGCNESPNPAAVCLLMALSLLLGHLPDGPGKDIQRALQGKGGEVDWVEQKKF